MILLIALDSFAKRSLPVVSAGVFVARTSECMAVVALPPLVVVRP